MPLRVISECSTSGPSARPALVELEDRILEQALGGETERVCAPRSASAMTSRRSAWRLGELGLLTPDAAATRRSTSG